MRVGVKGLKQSLMLSIKCTPKIQPSEVACSVAVLLDSYIHYSLLDLALNEQILENALFPL